jgi:hypothetical protein
MPRGVLLRTIKGFREFPFMPQIKGQNVALKYHFGLIKKCDHLLLHNLGLERKFAKPHDGSK